MNPVMDARIQCFWGENQKLRYERAKKELSYATMTKSNTLIDDTVLEYRSDDYLSEDLCVDDLDFSAFDDE